MSRSRWNRLRASILVAVTFALATGAIACGNGDPTPNDVEDPDAGDEHGDVDDDDVDRGGDDDDDEADSGVDDDDLSADDRATLDLIDQQLRNWSRHYARFTAANCACYSKTRIVEYEEACADGLHTSNQCADFELVLSDSIDECSRDVLLNGGEAFAEALECTAQGWDEISGCLAECPTNESDHSDCFTSQDLTEACPTFSDDLEMVADTINEVTACPDSSAIRTECDEDA